MKVYDVALNERTGSGMTMYVAGECAELGHVVRPLMVVIPGGGYGFIADREGEPVALRYMAAGYNACVLRYTIKRDGGWPLPLEDYERCIEVIRERAAEWNVDSARFAVAGFSAGGHLAACAATVAVHKPMAAVLVYPALSRKLCDLCQPGMPCPIEQVNEKTAPSFIVTARDDNIVPVSDALDFASALGRNGVPFELHVASYGGHGFSTATDAIRMKKLCSRLPHWVDDSLEWLTEVIGDMTVAKFAG